MGNTQAKGLIKEYVSSSRSLTKSQDSRFVQRIFKLYDKKQKGYLTREECLKLIDDALVASGLKKSILSKAGDSDAESFYREELETVYKEIDPQETGKVKLEDLSSPGLHTFHDFLNEIHSKLLERATESSQSVRNSLVTRLIESFSEESTKQESEPADSIKAMDSKPKLGRSKRKLAQMPPLDSPYHS